VQFIKTYWVTLLSGVLAVVAIVILVLGLTSDSVQKEMQQRLTVAADIDTLTRDPKNDACINAELQHRQKCEQEFKAALEVAERINKRDPLIEGAFPQPAQAWMADRFLETYRERLYALPREMRAGSLPTDQEVQDEYEILVDIERRKQEQERETGLAGKQPTEGTSRPPAGQVVPPGRSGPGWPPYMGAGRPPWGPGGGQPIYGGGPTVGQASNVSVQEARYRASVKKARAIRMYATADPTHPSFYISPVFESVKPTVREMWYAQVGLWVQEDVVRAIAKLNDEAARQLNEKDANVTNMPVKRLVGTRVLGYITSAGIPVPFTSLAGGMPAPTGASGEAIPPSFTGRKSDEQFDVVRFAVTVIVDRRDLLRLVDELTRVNFYQLVGASYVLPDPTDETNGYYYGEDPVVQATLDFEGYMARKVYLAMMPAEVLDDLGIKRPGAQ
jgi:hypothetical protein